jgi:voltage-gated potassium channel
MNPIRNIIVSLFCLVSIILFGTVCYHHIEQWSYIDSLYMTVITLSTVGFREVHQLSDAGQIFTIIIILSGTGIVAYAAGSVIQLIVQGK